MNELLGQVPGIIQEAAKSPLGLFALMIMILSILGFMFFRSSSERTRIAMFVLMFIGVAFFGAAAIRIAPNMESSSLKSDLPPASSPNQRNINGKWVAQISETDGNNWKIDFDFDVHEGNVLGMVSYPTGDGEIVDGKLVGDALSFMTKHTPQFETEAATMRFKGEVSDDSISFTMQSSSKLRKFTAVRVGK